MIHMQQSGQAMAVVQEVDDLHAICGEAMVEMHGVLTVGLPNTTPIGSGLRNFPQPWANL